MERIAPSTSQPISSPSYEYNPETKRATLTMLVELETPITGHHGKVARAELFQNGLLAVRPGFIWDFASGPAVNTPDMVYASIAHDALARMTVEREVPWKVRKQADKYFRQLLRQFGAHWFRAWYAYVAVRAYSMTLAKWRDRERRKGKIA